MCVWPVHKHLWVHLSIYGRRDHNAYQTCSNKKIDPNSPRMKTLRILTISGDQSFLVVFTLLTIVTINYDVKFDEQVGLGSFVLIVQLVSPQILRLVVDKQCHLFIIPRNNR